MRADLTQSDKDALRRCEKIIDDGLPTFVAVGKALRTIKEGRLYRGAGYRSFQVYCEKRWRMERSYAHRLIGAAEVTESIKTLPNGNKDGPSPCPQRESHTRELVKIKDPAEQSKVWTETIEEAEKRGENVTAIPIRETVRPRRKGKEEAKKTAVETSAFGLADGLGLAVEKPELVEAFQTRLKLAEIGRSIDALQRAIDNLSETDGSQEIVFQSVKMRIAGLKLDLRVAAPYSPCPSCRGRVGCEDCEGRRWVTKKRYEQLIASDDPTTSRKDRGQG